MTGQDFQTMLDAQAEHLETKARLTQAEKLLLSAKAELERRQRIIEVLEKSRNHWIDTAHTYECKLNSIPRWIRSIFRAD